MSDFSTAGTNYTGETMMEVIVRPAIRAFIPPFIDIVETKGTKLLTVTYFGPATHNSMAWADGFQGGVTVTEKEKSVATGKYKSEQTYKKSTYAALKQRESEDIHRGFQNGILMPDMMTKFPPELQTILQELDGQPDAQSLAIAEWKLQMQGIDISILNTLFLGDTNKLCLETAGGTFPNAVSFARYDADKRFNAADGIWKSLIASASTTPSVALGQVKKVGIALSAVSEVRTITLTGTSGTCNITILGKTKLATWTGSTLKDTCDAFVASWASYYLAFGMVITAGSTDTIVCTYSGYKGVAFAAPTVSAAITGNLTGSAASASPAAVPAGAMTAGLGISTLNLMKKGRSSALKSVRKENQVIYATLSVIENIEETLGVDGTGYTTSESQRMVLVNGIATQLQFNGFPIYEMPIDEAIDTYFGGYSPHRIIWTTKGNLKLIAAWSDTFGESARWFEKKDNAILTRTEFEIGGDFFEPLYTVVAFQS